MFDDDFFDDYDDMDQGDYDELAREVEDANVLYEKLRHLSTPQMACNECGGTGSLAGGSFGAMQCPTCMGMRTISHPSAQEVAIPDFAAMRTMLRSAINPKTGLLTAGTHRLPRLQAVQDLQKEGREYAALHAPELPKLPPLPGTPAAATHGLNAPGDKELDQLEAGETEDVADEDIGGW